MEGEVQEHDGGELPPNIEPSQAPHQQRPAGTRPRAIPIGPRTSVARAVETEDELGIRDWLGDMGGETEIKVGITRKKPLLGPHGEMVSGALETVEGFIDEDYLRETWGGGEFSLKVYTPKGPNGAFKYFRGRTIKIAGPPKMNGQLLGNGGAAAPVIHEEDTLAGRAFETMERNALAAQARADRIEQQNGQRPTGIDFGALRTFNEPLNEQLRAAQETIRELQMQMIAQSQKAPPRDEFRDRLMEKAVEGESARIEALRAQYEGRIDRLRDSHEDQIKRLEDRRADDIKRMEDRHNDDIKRLESRHEREIKNAERVLDAQTKGTDQAFQARLESLKEGTTRLERELAAAATKIASLEARKDQTIGEKADELIKVKEALDGIGGGDDKEDPWYAKVIDAVGNSEAAVKLISKISGGEPQAQQPQMQQQLPPPGIPFQTGDGNVYVRDAAGNVSVVDQGVLRQQRALAMARKKKRAQAGPPVGGDDADVIEDGLEDETEPVGRPPDATEMKIAINFMENALRNGTSPEQFGPTARALIPADILMYMQSVGMEKFLTGAKLEAGSPLTTMRGRQFVRAVAKFLHEGSTGDDPAPGA